MTVSKAYVDKTLVTTYDQHHFGGPGGLFVLTKDKAALAKLLPAAGGMLLDIPCGTGIYAAAFRVQGWQVVEADVSLPMLVLAGERDGGLRKVQCDITRMPFADKSVDAIATIRLFQHFQRSEMRAALAEMRRVIKPGGTVIFDTFRWTPRSFRWLPRRLLGRSRRGDMQVYSRCEVEEMIASAGLKLSDSTSLYLFSPIAYRRLPVLLLRVLDGVERVIPQGWLLRTFWSCTAE